MTRAHASALAPDTRWYAIEPVVEQHAQLQVVREDLLPGGSKLRFLPFLTAGAPELVFGGPFCGGAPLALAVLGHATGQRVTLFYAKRSPENWHRRQRQAQELGAQVIEVPMGFMTNVQAKARAYAAQHGALMLPLGFDLPAAEEPFVSVMERLRHRIGTPPQVWCVAGSGMLARCLGRAFPDAPIYAVEVGLKSRHKQQRYPPNVQLVPCRYDFAQEAKERPPFPSDPNYEAKGWEIARRQAVRGALFWNVLGG